MDLKPILGPSRFPSPGGSYSSVIYTLFWAAAKTAAQYPWKDDLLAGDKPVSDYCICACEASVLTLQMCVVVLGIRPCNFSFVLPLVWHLKKRKKNKLILWSMWCFKCLLPVGVSDNMKGGLQNAEDPFFLLWCSLFLQEGFMVYAQMELKYRSCVLMYLLPWYVHT